MLAIKHPSGLTQELRLPLPPNPIFSGSQRFSPSNLLSPILHYLRPQTHSLGIH